MKWLWPLAVSVAGLPLCSAAQDSQTVVVSNAFHGSEWEQQALKDEAVLLAANPGIVQRDGDNLVVSYDGRAVTTLQTTGGCDSYIVKKILWLYDATRQKKEGVADIVCLAGEFTIDLLIMPDGDALENRDASASPDGRLLVTGGEDNYMNITLLSLYQWPSPHAFAQFPAHCLTHDWQDDTHFQVDCRYDPTGKGDDETTVQFDADVWRDDAGPWRMQASRFTDFTIYGMKYGSAPDDGRPLPAFLAQAPKDPEP